MRSRAREALPWEPVLPAWTSAPVISFCNHVFIGICSKLEEFHHRVVTILHLPRGQRLNIENTSDLDKLRADETGRVQSVETNVPMGCFPEVFAGQTQESFKSERFRSHQLKATAKQQSTLQKCDICRIFQTLFEDKRGCCL